MCTLGTTKVLNEKLHELGLLAFSRMLLPLEAEEKVLLDNGETSTLWQVAELIGQAKTIALVGNSSNLRNSGSGANIDDNELVIRCNFPEIKDYSLDVGRKTNLMLFSESIRNRIERADPTVMGYDEVLALGLHPEPLFGLSESRVSRRTGITTLPPSTRRFISEISYSRSTTGLMAINLLCFIFQKNISLYGFDFYSQIESPHYFGQQKGAYLGHELQYERWYVENLLRNSCPERLIVH